MPRRSIVAFLADTHAGHRKGLCNPDVELVAEIDDLDTDEEFWTPELTATQQYLWQRYTEHREQLIELAGNDRIIAVHNGDLSQGDKHPHGLMKDVTREDQRVIAVANLLPLMESPNVTAGRVVSGTLAHEPEADAARVAARLARETGKDIRAFNHHRLRVDGVLFEVAHHGPFPGSRIWLEGNAALWHLRSRVLEDRRNGVEPARMYVYAHYHRYIRTPTLHETWEGREYAHDLIILPSYCGLTNYARKVTKSTPHLSNGMVAFEVVDGALARVIPIRDEVDLRSEESL